MPNDLLETAKLHLPPYLLPEHKQQLYSELRNFPEKFNYYTSKFDDEMLQGDGWGGFLVLHQANNESKKIHGVVLSNSCDISPENRRRIPPKIIFASIIKLSKYIEQLRKGGISEDEINTVTESIKRQEITSLFYLPKGGGLTDEHIAILDDVYSVPTNSIQMSDMNKLFTLSQSGIYLFILKLSIHFCRFNDGINRYI